ncbi:type I restriction enzyme R protein [Mycoplasma wenyonii str. Massachusetts]|uniref:type I site-specific deoxyribonuclease n=1 Tax=Mycoplasma wenyonii (strain Massachusetts) TaxID=1197325 RepID=I6YM70_MYCWM|nr:type I restriction endonuclease [Mycoplasma wenyonii]AFN65399.1 type I restriction enzyme R protein [Mycoplasma wenyonii str. Massachusetts]
MRSDRYYPRREREYLKFRTKEQRARTEAEWEEWLIKKLIRIGWQFRQDFQKEGKTKTYLLEKNLLIRLQNLYRSKHNKPYFKFSEDESYDLLEELKKTNYREINKPIVINSLLRREEKLEIPLIDQENIKNNYFEVIQQAHEYHKGKFSHIYDLVLLINGLPLVCIELKKATISIFEAFIQLKRYFKDRLVSEPLSIFNNLQLFMATNFQRVSYFWRRDIPDSMHLKRLTLRWCNHDSFQQLKWVNVLFSPARIIE